MLAMMGIICLFPDEGDEFDNRIVNVTELPWRGSLILEVLGSEAVIGKHGDEKKHWPIIFLFVAVNSAPTLWQVIVSPGLTLSVSLPPHPWHQVIIHMVRE